VCRLRWYDQLDQHHLLRPKQIHGFGGCHLHHLLLPSGNPKTLIPWAFPPPPPPLHAVGALQKQQGSSRQKSWATRCKLTQDPQTLPNPWRDQRQNGRPTLVSRALVVSATTRRATWAAPLVPASQRRPAATYACIRYSTPSHTILRQ
jgi:hypothetical protein